MDDQVYALTKVLTKIHVENIRIILDKDQSEKRERNVSTQYLVGDLIRWNENVSAVVSDFDVASLMWSRTTAVDLSGLYLSLVSKKKKSDYETQ